MLDVLVGLGAIVAQFIGAGVIVLGWWCLMAWIIMGIQGK